MNQKSASFSLNLLVLRCKDLQASKRFYEDLGIQFEKEQHGNGPIHYAAVFSGFVFELYPAETQATDYTRLGFSSTQFAESIVLTDPDGRKVEISPKK